MSRSPAHGLIMVFLLAGCQAFPQAQATNTAPVEPTFTATATALPTSTGLAVAYVGGSVPCFAGPQVDDNIVATIEITDAPEIRGIDKSGGFWAIQSEDGDFCWIEAAYVTASYNPDNLEIMMPTRTPPPPKPSAIQNATAKYRCFMIEFPNHVDATLTWDKPQWVDGYRVYREGKLLAELEANETKFVVTIERRFFSSASGLAIYTIEAYNSSGWTKVDMPIKWYCNQ